MIDVLHGPPRSSHGNTFPEVQRDFARMNINAHPPFSHNGDNLYGPPNLPSDVHSGLHHEDSNGQIFNDLDSPLPRYEGFMLTKAEFPGQEKKWLRVKRKEMPWYQAQFRSEIQKEKRKGVNADKVYNSKEMNGSKREQVDRLIRDKILQNPTFDYKLVSLKLDVLRNGMTNSMRVILKRENTSSDAFTRVQALNGEIVDLTKDDVSHGVGESAHGSSRGSPPPVRNFMHHQKEPMLPESRLPSTQGAEPWAHVRRPDIPGSSPQLSPSFEHTLPSFSQPLDNSFRREPAGAFRPSPDDPLRRESPFGPPPSFQQPHHHHDFQTEISEEQQDSDFVPAGKKTHQNDRSDNKRSDNKHDKNHGRNHDNNYEKSHRESTSHSEFDGSESLSDYSDFSKTRSNQTRDTEVSADEYRGEKMSSGKYKKNRRNSYSSQEQYHGSSDKDDHRHGPRLGRKDSRQSSRGSHEDERNTRGGFRRHRRRSPHHSPNSSQSSGVRYYIDDFEVIPSSNSRHERPSPFRRTSSISQDYPPSLHQRTSSYDEEARATRRPSGIRGNRMSSLSHPVDVFDERAMMDEIAKNVKNELRVENLAKENEELREAMMENMQPMGPRGFHHRPAMGSTQPIDQYVDLSYSEPRRTRRYSGRHLQRGGLFAGLV